ncbi:hypothetical protein [Streptomyces litchfieldiae]|uniref:Uncharacterized protein n=1 Tax=Streptomyces litchfieldiae TaxID=3075543 RepID=A0ABU2MJM8_9ACTN|nr:hypothetical protein [Streptomyces sp. DSM 44938]MDT0341811.1 hypothetical protein [Streptomyces sp. DSM 44938]
MARLEIVGAATLPVAVAAARLAREMMRSLPLGDGWAVLHASAVAAEDGRTVLTFGGKGVGKTTTALTRAALGRHSGACGCWPTIGCSSAPTWPAASRCCRGQPPPPSGSGC